MMENNGESDQRTHRTESIELGAGETAELSVDISDALSERDKVKFTVHTRTTLKQLGVEEASVQREHDEFVWLHDAVVECIDYAGLMVPPAPPRPDFDASRDKLQRLSEGENTMIKDEFAKMKKELEAEYLATFKKTVATHEVFLCRLAAHPVFRNDHNLHVFLTYDGDLNVRGKNRREAFGSVWRTFSKSADELLLTGQKDVSPQFDQQRTMLLDYHTHIRETTARCDRMTRAHKALSDCFMKTASGVNRLATGEKHADLRAVLLRANEAFEGVRKLEARVAADEDLKESDSLRYFSRETQAAKDLLYRRVRCLANYEAANKNLERARAKNKDIAKAETEQQTACETFEKISESAGAELDRFRQRRVLAFKRNLLDLAELEVKHAKAHHHLLKSTIAVLKDGNL